MITRFPWPYGYVRLEELIDWMRSHPLPDGRVIPLCVWSAAGQGKTQRVRQYCREHDLDLQTFQAATTEQAGQIIGLEYIDPESKETRRAVPTWLPQDGPDNKGGILFLDELNRAKPEVLQGLMELLGEGGLSTAGYKLPPGWSIVAAANPNEQGYDVTTLDDAMLDRMLHYAPGFSAAEWTRWAERSGMADTVVNMALQNQDLIAKGEAELPVEVQPAMTPRSLEYLGALYEPEMELRILDCVARGLLGGEAAEVMVEQHLDEAAPLNGRDVLRGRFLDADGSEHPTREFVLRYGATRPDLLRASTERAIAQLVGTPAREHPVLDNLYAWLVELPDQVLVRVALPSMRDAIPDWLGLVLDRDLDGRISSRVPKNLALMRRPGRQQIEAERIARTSGRSTDGMDSLRGAAGQKRAPKPPE